MRQSGFTLLELSIVLVIIGLIIGGVTVGSQLIRQAEVTAYLNDLRKYEVAVRTFKLKYRAIPGDMANASSYWPNCATPSSDCDGNGNGRIIQAEKEESPMVWRHLALAGVISGSYTGFYGPDGNDMLPGVNFPVSTLAPDAYLFYATFDDYHEMYGLAGLTFMVAQKDITRGVVTPGEAASVDTKIDDGKAGLGRFLTVNYDYSNNGGCVDADYAAPGPSVNYLLENQDFVCRVFYFY